MQFLITYLFLTSPISFVILFNAPFVPSWLSRESPEEFSKAMLASLEESAREAGELAIREKLEDVLPIVSVSYLAKEYFKKTPQWFYQRLNGNIVNGKRVSFTEEEIRTLSSALDQIGNRLKESSAALN